MEIKRTEDNESRIGDKNPFWLSAKSMTKIV